MRTLKRQLTIHILKRKNETNELLDIELKKEMTEISKESKDKLLDDFIESEDKTIKKFELIENRMTFINLILKRIY